MKNKRKLSAHYAFESMSELFKSCGTEDLVGGKIPTYGCMRTLHISEHQKTTLYNLASILNFNLISRKDSQKSFYSMFSLNMAQQPNIKVINILLQRVNRINAII